MPGGEPLDDVRRVLVPLADPDRAPLALGVAASLIEGEPRGRVTLAHYSKERLDEEEREAFREAVTRAAREEEQPEPEALFSDDSPVELDFRRYQADLAEALADRSQDYDAMVLGMSPDNLLKRTVLGLQELEEEAEEVKGGEDVEEPGEVDDEVAEEDEAAEASLENEEDDGES